MGWVWARGGPVGDLLSPMLVWPAACFFQAEGLMPLGSVLGLGASKTWSESVQYTDSTR